MKDLLKNGLRYSAIAIGGFSLITLFKGEIPEAAIFGLLLAGGLYFIATK